MPEVLFAGSEGRLEGRYHHSSKDRAPLALILHPHPLQGGTMNNRITYTMYQTFRRMDFSVLRFNFRSVGKGRQSSEDNSAEISDAAAALDWMQSLNPEAEALWISGYSFGAYIGMQLLMRRPEISGWVMAGLPAGLYDFSFLAPCPCGGLVIHGEADTFVPEASVQKLVDKLNTQKGVSIDYRVLPDANHVFTNKTDLISSTIEDYVRLTGKKTHSQAA